MEAGWEDKSLILEINLTTPALLFPAISLLLLAYFNRFLAIAGRIRQLKIDVNQENLVSTRKQLANLKKRLNMILTMQAIGVASILFCIISMSFFFAEYKQAGHLAFACSLVFMLTSLVISLWEILISSKALKIELQEMENMEIMED